ncbi:hypothetical protein pah_c022o188 [Parachlamydia acanthamoebae str. Hall's coccus]|jgi:hypothetical protein|nr:hypothetical protein pah_c022o188 [Parachlamydia acanthamoebae str. Hall's coccus]
MIIAVVHLVEMITITTITIAIAAMIAAAIIITITMLLKKILPINYWK